MFSFMCKILILMTLCCFWPGRAQFFESDRVPRGVIRASLLEMIDRVSVDSLTCVVKELSGEVETHVYGVPVTIAGRHIYQPGNDLAGSYIKQKLEKYGLEVHVQPFTSGENVYAFQRGSRVPDDYYILCAHYDGMPNAAIAPAADDNASGVAAVLEAARILSDYSFPYSINYALWDAEEVGLRGSQYYAENAGALGEKIQGVINLDMIAWESNQDNRFNVFYTHIANSLEIANTMASLSQTLGLDLVPLLVHDGGGYSDHYYFWRQNYSAVMMIEDYYQRADFNPYYHTPADSFGHFDVSFFTNCTKLALATTAHYADSYEEVVHLSYDFPAAGWYLISIPGTADDMSVGTLFPSALPFVLGYENGYVSKYEFEPGQGYWIYLPQAGSAVFDVSPIYEYVRTIDSAGWALIGSVNGDVLSSNVLVSPAGAMEDNFWDQTGPGYSETGIIACQGGYWARFYAPCTLTVATTPHLLSKQSQPFADVISPPGAPPNPPSLDYAQPLSDRETRFVVLQNYPNPFNSSTSIRFKLPELCDVKVRVFNIRGEIIRSVARGILGAGEHQVKWDGKDEAGLDVPSGSYFVRVATGGAQQVMKVMLIR